MDDNDKDDGLGLSLSMDCAQNQPLSSSCMQNRHPKNTWNELFRPSDRHFDTTSFLRGIDVNRAPTTVVDCEEENGVSSPNNTISSISGKRNEREIVGDETEAERGSCSQASDDENDREKSIFWVYTLFGS